MKIEALSSPPVAWPTPGLAWADVAVVMARVPNLGAGARWQPWRWELAEVVAQQGAFGHSVRRLPDQDGAQRWLHPGLRVELFKDDAEGLFLNASTDAPSWFVLWRLEEDAQIAPPEPLAVPQAVSLSYHDAGRWLDAQEQVHQVPLNAPARAWLQAFCAAHYQAEPKQRRRPQSFQPLTDRFGQPARVSALKRFGPTPGAEGG